MQGNGKVSIKRVSREEYDRDFEKYHYSLFLVSDYAESFRDDRELYYLHFEMDGKVVAKLAAFRMNGTKMLGKWLYCDAAPAMLDEDEYVYNECLSVLLSWAKKNRLSKIVVGYLDQQHQLYCKAKGYISRTNREFIRFFDPAEEVVTFSKSLRYNVRKALRVNPVFVEETSERILQKLHELLQATHACRNDKHKGHYRMYPYIGMTKEGVDKLFYSGYIKLFHVEVDGEIHCVRLAIEKDKRMFGLMIAGDEFSYKHSLAHFLQHELITKLHNEGYKYYNIAGSKFREDGLVAYKESLGCMRYTVHGGYTRFLTFPRVMLNPLMDAGKVVARNKKLKKVIAVVYKTLTGFEADL
jgi:hypothetical protein